MWVNYAHKHACKLDTNTTDQIPPHLEFCLSSSKDKKAMAREISRNMNKNLTMDHLCIWVRLMQEQEDDKPSLYNSRFLIVQNQWNNLESRLSN